MKKMIYLYHTSNALLVFSCILTVLFAGTFTLSLESQNGKPVVAYPDWIFCIVLLILTILAFYFTVALQKKSEKLMKQRYQADNLPDCYKKFKKEIEDLH